MVQVLSLDKVTLISTSLEALLYGQQLLIISSCIAIEGFSTGFSVLMFAATIWVLVMRKPNGKINHRMVTVASLLLLLSTLHIGCDIWRIYTGFIVVHDTYPGGPMAWFSNERDPSFLFKNVIYSIQTALGDGVVIYRCHMVWRSVPVLVLPVLLWLGVCTTAIGVVYELAQVAPTSDFIYAQRTSQWITAFFWTTFVCNLVASGILAFKLWTIDKSVQSMRLGKSMIKPVLATIIDAGALYSATVLMAIVGFTLKSNVQYIMLDIIIPVISIVFYMVILRVAVASARDTVLPFQSRGPVPRSDIVSIQVQMEQLTEVDRDFAPKVNDTETSR
ncbi:hypothetical protein C8R47DRAFT_974892 [Mycena vitilis]|nr:hypothetical protein C8R47DRAFT_974892 [Mycena vitilis]